LRPACIGRAVRVRDEERFTAGIASNARVPPGFQDRDTAILGIGDRTMTRERLLQLSIDELVAFAGKEDIELPESVEKEDIIDAILEELEEIEGERSTNDNPSVKIEEKKYVVAHDEELELFGRKERTLPATYDTTRIVLLVRDPTWAFTYWEISENLKKDLIGDPGFEGVLLRIHDITRVDWNGSNSNYSIDIPVLLTDDNWYINIPNPGSDYIIELLKAVKDSKAPIATSNVVHVPREGFSDARDEEWDSRNTDKIIELIMTDFEYFLPTSGAIPQRIISFVSSSFIPYMHNK
jgi:hypothetical protein